MNRKVHDATLRLRVVDRETLCCRKGVMSVKTPWNEQTGAPKHASPSNGSVEPETKSRVENLLPHVAKILVGVDGRSAHDAALETAVNLAHAFRAELHIITVRPRRPWQEVLALDIEIPQPELDEYFKEVEHQLRSAATALGACVTSVTVTIGDPGSAILKHIKKLSPDMVVLCRNRKLGANYHGMSLGGVSKKVSSGSPCPVVLVPAKRGR